MSKSFSLIPIVTLYVFLIWKSIIDLSFFNYIWISVNKIVATVDIISERMSLDPASTRTGFHWPPFNTVDHLHLHVISPIEKMNAMRKLMFNPNTFWFVSVSIEIIKLIV